MVEMNFGPLVWFIAGIIFFLLELAIPGFVIFFFGLGAWITAIVTLFGVNDINIQLAVFLGSSLLTLILFRKEGRKIFEGKVKIMNNADDEILENFKGQKAKVVKEIIPGDIPGKVEFRGTLWNAVSDEKIEQDEVVEIIQRDNITLKVKRVNKS
ncbi:MAG: NfeD family protein [Ignavibacteria bacterium]|nr:NfeD family protein [Ignavibacteria bacterium]